MIRRILSILVAALLGGCTLPLGNPSATLSLTLAVPSASGGSGRVILSETSVVKVLISQQGVADRTERFEPQVVNQAGVRLVKITLKAQLGPCVLKIQALDAAGTVLSEGQTTVSVTPGANQASLTMKPGLVLASGTVQHLAAGATAYFTIPGSLGSVNLAGNDSTFWVVDADGGYTGGGTPVALTASPVAGADVYLRVEQGGDGQFTTLSNSGDLQLAPSYQVSAGQSSTQGATSTQMLLTWSNPALDYVFLYRATTLLGPYSLLYSGPGSSFLDHSGAPLGMTPGTTYYYAIAKGGSTIPSASGVVPGVVAGTTLVWDAALNAALPVIGTPYLKPQTALIQGTPGGRTDWNDSELPGTAILAGGYTYWVWGTNTANEVQGLLAAFDSHGALMNSYNISRRYFTDLTRVGSSIRVTGQVQFAPDVGITDIPWASIDWFGATALLVNVSFQFPTNPSVVFVGGLSTLNKSTAQTMVVDPKLSNYPGFSLVRYLIDGQVSYPDTSVFNVAAGPDYPVSIESTKLTVGTHELMILVTDGTHIYSATFHFTVGNVPSMS